MTLPSDPRVRAADDSAICEAARRLQRGELVGFPTETVYGLGANALDAEAVARIFVAKGRPATNPLIVHVADAAMARQVVADWPEVAQRLAEACWPGPLTLVLKKRPNVPDAVSAGLPSVGVRVPAHPVALALIRAAGLPIAAPSANRYMGVSPTLARHVADALGDAVALILDGGPSSVGLESTVLDLTGAVPRVLRPGGLPTARLRELLGGPIAFYEPDDPRDAPEPARSQLSPGLARRHYAPRARVELVADGPALVLAIACARAAGERVGGIAIAPAPDGLAGGEHITCWPADAAAYGARLYAAFHLFDELGVARLVVQMPPDTEAWRAVRDRLTRAASNA